MIVSNHGRMLGQHGDRRLGGRRKLVRADRRQVRQALRNGGEV